MLIGDYGSISSSEEDEIPKKINEEEKEGPKRKREEEALQSNLAADATKRSKTIDEKADGNDPFAGLV
jgi:hypothetical protein